MEFLPNLLVTQMVQVTIVALIAWAAIRLFAGNRPHVSHALWALVVLKCLTPPIFSLPTSPFSLLPLPGNSQASTSDSLPSKAKSIRSIPSQTESDKPRHTVIRTQAPFYMKDAWTTPASLNHTKAETHSKTVNSVRRTEPLGTLFATAESQTGWMLLWLISAGVCLVITTGRLCLFMRRVNRNGVVDGELQHRFEAQVNEITAKLGMQRKVRVQLVDCLIGPAVVGWLRPRILLPCAIVERQSVEQLEILLAHELVHIRRGDLVWAFVQTLATSVCWFHPLVWMASRRMTLAAEHACDEETIASIGCKSAAYARSLLDVLERKHQLQIAPALPGVRPVDITAKRMERIMRLGHGCNRRCPWWAHLLLLLGAVVALPGAAWFTPQDARESTRKPGSAKPASQHPIQSSPSVGKRLPKAKVLIESSEILQIGVDPGEDAFELRSYDVGELLKKTQDYFESNVEQAEITVAGLVHVSEHWRTGSKPSTPNGMTIEFLVDGVGSVSLGGDNSLLRVIGNKLYAFAPKEHHEKIASTLETYRTFGFEQITVQVRLATVPAEFMETLDVNWNLEHPIHEQPKVAPAADTLGVSPDQEVRLASYVAHSPGEVTPTTLHAIIDQKSVAQLTDAIQSDPRSNILHAPKVTLFNGQQAEIVDGVQRPFVVSMQPVGNGKAYQPNVQVVHEGLTIDLRAILNEDQTNIELKSNVTAVSIAQVDTFSFKLPGGEAGEMMTLQQPVLRSQILKTSASIPSGSTLVVSGIQQVRDRDAAKMVTLAFLTPTHVTPEEYEIDPTADIRPHPTANPIDHTVLSTAYHAVAEPELEEVKMQFAGEDLPDELLAPLVEVLKQQGIMPRITGAVQFSIDEKILTLNGEDVVMRSEDTDDGIALVSADSIRLVFDLQDEIFQLDLHGGVKFNIESEELQGIADHVFIDSAHEKYLLEGGVHLQFQGTQITAERFDVSSGLLTLAGLAKLERTSDEGQKEQFEADVILLNMETDEVKTVDLPRDLTRQRK